MRFFILLITLIFAVSSFAYSGKKFDIVKRSISLSYDDQLSNANNSTDSSTNTNDGQFKKCLFGFLFSKYVKCFPEKVNLDNVKTNCAVYKSDNCQALYQDPFKIFSECKDVPAFKGLMNQSITLTVVSMDLVCTMKDDGEVCPYTEKVLIGDSPKTEEEEKILIEQTCKYSSCSEAFAKYCDDMLKIVEQSPELQKVITDEDIQEVKDEKEYLESMKCSIKQFISGASNIKIGGSILLTFALLLLSYF